MVLFVGEKGLFDFIYEICHDVTYDVGVEEAEAVIIGDASDTAVAAAKAALLINLPVLGILDGYRVLAQLAGGRCESLEGCAEGRQEVCVLDCKNPIFDGMQSVIRICRGKPEALASEALPPDICPAARGEDGEIVAFSSADRAGFFAVNFYINSNLTPEGGKIIENFMKIKGVYGK